MPVRNFSATTKPSNDVLATGNSMSTLMDAVDTARAAAAANVTIAGDGTALGLVTDIQTAMDAVRAEYEDKITDANHTVAVVINGSPTQNQIRIAFENIMRNIDQSATYSRG